MKLLVERIYTNPNYNKVIAWGKLITITASSQALIQGLGLLGGILVIRLLPTKEYALYTLANTMLGTMIILADGGITTGVMAQGGKVWQDKQRLGAVLVTGFELRKKFALGSLLIATPVLLYLLRHQGASWLMTLLVILSLIPAFITTLSGTLLETAPKLLQDITPLQKNQVGASIGRLAILTLTLFSFPWAFIAVLAAGIPQIWANKALRKTSAQYADWNQQPDSVVRQEILGFVKRAMPGAIYYCLSSQITIWLISIFGSTSAVAQVGALGRLATVLSLAGIVFTTLVLPRYARLPNKFKLLLSRYLQIQFYFIVLGIFTVFVVWLFSAEILKVLGPNYATLKNEIVLSITNGCLGLLAGASYSTSTSRGWIINPAISIPVTIGAIILGAVLFNVGTLRGILKLNTLVALAEIAMYFLYNLIKISKLENKVDI